MIIFHYLLTAIALLFAEPIAARVRAPPTPALAPTRAVRGHVLPLHPRVHVSRIVLADGRAA